ncbi:MAG: hypothetical protein Q4Q58_05525 [Thermoplasmata archaeon]|nr:hypothetical protein [Thermoplasmata archaeon]
MNPRRGTPSPEIFLDKGRPALRFPYGRIPHGTDAVVRVRHSAGVREMGRLRPGSVGFFSAELTGVPVLDGFEVTVGDEKVFELYPTDMLVFVDGREVEDPRGRPAVVLRERGSGIVPDGTEAGSVTRWGMMELVSVVPARPAPEPAAEPDLAEPIPEAVEESVPEEEPESECEPEPEPVAEAPNAARMLGGEPGSFVGGSPMFVMREYGAIRRFVVTIPRYVPLDGTHAEVRLLCDDRILPAGLDDAWFLSGAELDIASCGIRHCDAFTLEVDGRRVYRSPGGNIMFFSESGMQLTTPRGRVTAVHPAGVQLGLSGGAKVRVISSDTQGEWVFERMELGAKGKVFIKPSV